MTGNRAFLFTTLRHALPPRVAIDLNDALTPLARELVADAERDDVAAMVERAAEFAASPRFAGPRDLADVLGEPLPAFIEWLAAADRQPKDVRGHVERHAGARLAQLVPSDPFRAAAERLIDSLVVSTLVAAARSHQPRLVSWIRTLELVRELASGDAVDVRRSLDRRILLPRGLADRAPPGGAPEPAPGPVADGGRVRVLRAALAELEDITVDDLRTVVEEPEDNRPAEVRSWLLSPAAERRLSAPTRELLTAGGLAEGRTSLPAALRLVETALAREPDAARATVHESRPGTYRPQLAGGSISDPSVAVLRLTREELLRYEPGEVAHVENVMRGELRRRTHTRKLTVEESLRTETETIEERERNLQSTDRFELQKESARVIEEETELDVGVTVSASYGPTSISTNTGFGTRESAQETDRTAVRYAREVTERAAERVQARVRVERLRRTVEEFSEENLHELRGVGETHSVGVYRWLDKVHRAQVLDYGKRVMLDLVVPQPGALLLQSLAGLPPELRIDPPAELTIGPGDIGLHNYLDLAAEHGAAAIEPPPEPLRTFAAAMTAQDPSQPVAYAAKELMIDDGYEATAAAIVPLGKPLSQPVESERLVSLTDVVTIGFMTVGVGRVRRPVVGPQVPKFPGEQPPFNLSKTGAAETGTIPIVVHAQDMEGFAVGIEVLARRTPRAIQAWQLKTYDVLRQAHEARKRAFDEAVAAASARAAVGVGGRNPAQSRAVERDELKRQTTSLLLRRRVDFGSVSTALTVDGLPEIDFAAANRQADTIRFFEEAFEWTNLTYLLYPYFWAGRGAWDELLRVADADPLHARFLQAGAARVVLPVKPGFEEAVAHFMTSGRVWAAGTDAPVPDAAWQALVDDVRSGAEQLEAGVPVGEPWEVRLPTSLVMLQPDTPIEDWVR